MLLPYNLIIKGGWLSRSVYANLTLCQLHYVYLCKDVVQIMYAPLEATAIVSREVRSCNPVRV